jgi:glycolate oxidase FAD binding subunit
MAADPGYGLLRMHWPGDGEALSPEQMVDVINHLRGWTVSIGGYLVVERCPLSVKEQTDVWGDVEGGALMQRIKQRLDPQGVLNPSRFVAGI